MIIGNKTFDELHTHVCGILNVTPDSFSDGGKFNNLDGALSHVEQMISEGMELLDIGGESTRPGYTKISDEEEIERVVPVIEAVKSRFDIPVSLDTYKSRVAKAGIDAGADLINDIWGLKYDVNMAKVIADADVACCLMHNRVETDYKDFVSDVMADMEESIRIAKAAGIADDKIMLDPGVGFAKTYEQNVEIIKNMDKLLDLGYPYLLGCSRKSVIGLTLDVDVNNRLEGTLVTSTMAVLKHALFVRVHDIEANVRAIKMAEALR